MDPRFKTLQDIKAQELVVEKSGVAKIFPHIMYKPKVRKD